MNRYPNIYIQRIMRAHKQRGEMFNNFTEQEKSDFNELRKTPATEYHKEWLVKKLAEIDLDYLSK